MVKNNEKLLEIVKSTFFIMPTRGSHKDLVIKTTNEQPAFGCWPAFGSHSQLLTNWLFSLFFYMSLSCAWWKRYFLTIFYCFFIVLIMHVFAGWNTQQVNLFFIQCGIRTIKIYNLSFCTVGPCFFCKLTINENWQNAKK